MAWQASSERDAVLTLTAVFVVSRVVSGRHRVVRLLRHRVVRSIRPRLIAVVLRCVIGRLPLAGAVYDGRRVAPARPVGGGG